MIGAFSAAFWQVKMFGIPVFSGISPMSPFHTS